MKMIVDCITADVPTRNGRIYPKAVLQETIGKFQEKILTNCALGELELPSKDFGSINCQNVSHRINEINLNEETGKIEADVEILNIPMGKVVRTLIENHTTLELAPRFFGTLNEDNTVNISDIISFDLVLADD